jgi:hypothetical protein
VFFATSRLKAELVGPLKEGCLGGGLYLELGDIDCDIETDLSDEAGKRIASPPLRSEVRLA